MISVNPLIENPRDVKPSFGLDVNNRSLLSTLLKVNGKQRQGVFVASITHRHATYARVCFFLDGPV